MIFAAIDIGSNAGRLLVATVLEHKTRIVTEKITLVRVPLRLGMDVFEKGKISKERKELVVNTFKAYKQLMKVYKPVDFIACATSAMRDSSNGPKLIKQIKEETGIELKIIDGLTEAKVISAASNMNMNITHDHSLYIDVGGGSTELTWYEKNNLIAAKSFKIGTIRELYNLTKKEEWNDLKDWITKFEIKKSKINCICSGGNINKLTKLYGNRNRNLLSYEELQKGLNELNKYTVEQRIAELGMRADRADVIVPAGNIFERIMRWGEINILHAPKIGLADGLIVDLYKKHKGEKTVVL